MHGVQPRSERHADQHRAQVAQRFPFEMDALLAIEKGQLEHAKEVEAEQDDETPPMRVAQTW
jgi:hypothetical protein